MSFPNKTFLSLTLAGWVTIGMIGCLCYWSLILRDVILWIVWMSLALYLLYAYGACVWVSSLIRRNLSRPGDASKFPRALECNRQQSTGMSFPQLSWTPLTEVLVTWKVPTDVEAWINSHDHEVAKPLRRGLASSLLREMQVTDLFRLVRIRVERESGHPVTILPANGCPESEFQFAAGEGGEVFSLAGKPEGDRFNLRVYNPGDPIKFVMWRRLTPDGQYYVRLPENVEAPHVTILFLAGDSDDASAELARFLIDAEPMGSDWSFHVSTSPESVSSPGEALRLLAESGNQRPDDGGMVRGCMALEEAVRNSQGSFTMLLVPDHRAVGELGAALMSMCDVKMCGALRSDEYTLRHEEVRRVRMKGGGGTV